MSYEPLHHKYRPQTFADLVGQSAIATTLTNAIRSRRIAPAYLFTGPRGTGKTSSARILAKSLNCLQHPEPTAQPCGECDVCLTIARGTALDVIEIDAASNTGVDNIRELIERAQFAPVQCRYKVYVVDECHMLSTSAFNALLKTLEEPPDRVVFVLATTDPQRVLPTIISRCQRFDFRRIELAAMVQHLQTIATQEQIAITPEAVQLVAQLSQGGLRDAESMLDQLSLLTGEITVEAVWDLVGAVPERDILTLLNAIAQRQPAVILEQVRQVLDRGREPLVVLQNLTSYYRDLLIAKTAPERQDLVALTADTWQQLCTLAQSLDAATILAEQQHLRTCESQIKSTTQPRLWLEVSLLGLLSLGPTESQPPPIQLPVREVRQPTAITSNGHQSHAAPVTTAPVASPVTEPVVHSPSVEPTSTAEDAIASVPVSTPAPTPSHGEIAPPVEPPAPPPVPAASPLPTAEPPAAPPPSLTPSQPELDQLWHQLLAQMHPLTKALLGDHGRLLMLSRREARIGIKPSLMKIAQNQIVNIETTCHKVLERQIKVNLIPLDSPTSPVPPSATPQAESPVMPVSPAVVTAPPLAQAISQPVVQAPVQTEPAPQPIPLPALPDQPVEAGLRDAARSLAQFFNGVVVSLEADEEDSHSFASPSTAEDNDLEDLEDDE